MLITVTDIEDKTYFVNPMNIACATPETHGWNLYVNNVLTLKIDNKQMEKIITQLNNSYEMVKII
jgi:hypothetical protein